MDNRVGFEPTLSFRSRGKNPLHNLILPPVDLCLARRVGFEPTPDGVGSRRATVTPTTRIHGLDGRSRTYDVSLPRRGLWPLSYIQL